MTQSSFVIRTVKKGQVVIYGEHWKPSEQFLAYDGRLDGMRFCFGRYPSREPADGPGQFSNRYLCLWGTEHESKHCCAWDDQDFDCAECSNPPHVIDGRLPWYWWENVKRGGEK